MYFTQDKITEIFYLTDEFCTEFQKSIQGHLLGNPSKKKPKMSQSEVITILIIFHGMQHKNLKHFYINFVQTHLTDLFPKTVSYNRFATLPSLTASMSPRTLATVYNEVLILENKPMTLIIQTYLNKDILILVLPFSIYLIFTSAFLYC